MPAITVENLGKKYLLNHQRQQGSYLALRDVMAEGMKSLGRRIIGRSAAGSSSHEEFWALKDVSVAIRQGDRVGIIGRNGAGKSTLLKILSRITEPTTGSVRIRGRVASLLEVGTGFHPELTGRENIFLNGAILGMCRGEITRKFDEIVAFAEVERFLDTPVKRFSSGMYVRLAFAVAAHLEPEILVVDEVLAVGDAQFQQKCLGKMEEVSAREGRTVLFVSHNMAAVRQLCQRGILLNRGAIEHDGDIRDAVQRYTAGGKEGAGTCEWLADGNRTLANQYFELRRLALTDEAGATLPQPLRNDCDPYVTVEFDLIKEDPAFQIGFGLYDSENRLLFWSFSTDSDQQSWPRLGKGRNVLRTRLQRNLLNEGAYRLSLLAACYHREWILRPDDDNPSIDFEIVGGLSESPYWYEKRRGLLAPVLRWEAVARG